MYREITLFVLCTARIVLSENQSNIEDLSGMTASNLTKKPSGTCSDEDAICVLPLQCPAHFYNPDIKKCTTLSGRQGVCCTTGRNLTGDFKDMLHERASISSEVDDEFLSSLARQSRRNMKELKAKEVELLAMEHPPVIRIGSPNYGHFRSKRVFTDLPEIVALTNKALEIALATQAFKGRRGISDRVLEWNLIHHDLMNTPLKYACRPTLECPHVPEKFRRLDGTCNNLRNAEWGAQISAFSRLLPPSYEDGIWLPRLSKRTKQPLPSPRLISTALFPEGDSADYDHTMMLMQFGQFLSHDVTFSVDTTFPDGEAISCCTEDGTSILPPRYLHHACMPIPVPMDDPFFSKYGLRCMNFVRSTLISRGDCTLGYTQQLNKVTHFIDASPVYGTNLKELRELRSFRGGQLKIFEDYGRKLLPLTRKEDACLTMEKGSACFDSGDSRSNQVVGLVVLHTLFLREHNRVAAVLEELNPYWTDEDIFWEARRIVIAELQVIAYKEFLPCLLGETAMDQFELWLSEDNSYSEDYDSTIDPSITNEFTSAAYRFGHSMVDGLLRIYGKTKMEEMISLPEVMFQPARLRKWEFFDEILTTLTTEPVQKVDRFISEALTRYLFKSGNPFGLDLASINIQRGRDHGLRPYNDYRQLVGLPRMMDFSEFGQDIGDRLRHLYETIDDVDLWVGGLLEPKEEGVLGPTFRDMVADQFSRLRRGDRYFFDNDPEVNPGFFTIDQLNELRKASMSRIVCDNSDGILLARQALNAFRKPGVVGNEFFDCTGPVIPRVDLSYWQD